MNKEQLISNISVKANLTKKKAEEVLKAMLETIMESVAEGEKVVLVGFGTFEPRARQERKGINPQTGQSVTIPATTVPAFSAGKAFKEKVASV